MIQSFALFSYCNLHLANSKTPVAVYWMIMDSATTPGFVALLYWQLRLGDSTWYPIFSLAHWDAKSPSEDSYQILWLHVTCSLILVSAWVWVELIRILLPPWTTGCMISLILEDTMSHWLLELSPHWIALSACASNDLHVVHGVA